MRNTSKLREAINLLNYCLFGGSGIIYLYIKREDLLARRFDSIKFAM